MAIYATQGGGYGWQGMEQFQQQMPQAGQSMPSNIQTNVGANKDVTSQMLTGEYWMNGGNKGNMATGGTAAALGGGAVSGAAAQGDKFGRSANSVDDAFMKGAKGSFGEMNDKPMMYMGNPDPTSNALAGGIGGVAGYAGVPYVSSIF